jgi:hypothetical protein
MSLGRDQGRRNLGIPENWEIVEYWLYSNTRSILEEIPE